MNSPLRLCNVKRLPHHPLLWLAGSVPIPTIGVWLAVYADLGTLGSIAWIVAKIWLFMVPLLWWKFGDNEDKNPFRLGVRSGLLMGLLWAVILGVGAFASYWFIGRYFLDFSKLKGLLMSAGVSTPKAYGALALYFVIINSLLEEIIFRWFMYLQVRLLLPLRGALVISGLIFTVHHTVAMVAYVPWQWNAVASVGVFSGGVLWSYLYHRYNSLWPSYVSHIGADVGVFSVGYLALFS